MRSRILLAVLVFAGCATPEAKKACFPVASWSSPMMRCQATAEAPPPVAEVKPEPEATKPEPEATKPEPEAAKPESPPTADLGEDTIDSTDTVNFDEDSANLDARSKALVADVARVMNEHPEITKLQIEGHTDSLAGEKHNMKLAKERIDSVRAYLVEKGVSTKRLTIKVFGEKKPIADNGTEAGRAENRRVVFRVIKAKHGKKKKR